MRQLKLSREGIAINKDGSIPTEREWLIMEAVWDSGEALTSAEILGRIDERENLCARTERVLLHNLCKKGLLGYSVDERDSRVYHYYPLRTREACLREKSAGFINAYFRGSSSGAAAALLKTAPFTDEQLRELTAILEERKGGDSG